MEYFEGHKIVIKNGYAAIYLPHHPAAYKDGTVYVHRLQAYKLLGRELTSDEHVHHIDGNKLNNDLNNLMVFATDADHTLFHNCYDNNLVFSLHYKNGVWRCTSPHRRTSICPVCGKMKCAQSQICLSCHSKQRRERIPSKNILKQDIYELPFTKVGEKYKVTDNAVRKWCKTYGLPYKRKDIRKMSLQEWESL